MIWRNWDVSLKNDQITRVHTCEDRLELIDDEYDKGRLKLAVIKNQDVINLTYNND